LKTVGRREKGGGGGKSRGRLPGIIGGGMGNSFKQYLTENWPVGERSTVAEKVGKKW